MVDLKTILKLMVEAVERGLRTSLIIDVNAPTLLSKALAECKRISDAVEFSCTDPMDMWPIKYPSGTEWIFKTFTNSFINLPEEVPEDMHQLLITLDNEFVSDWLPVLSEVGLVIASLLDQFPGYEDSLAVKHPAAPFNVSIDDSPVSRPQVSFARQSYSSEDEDSASVDSVIDKTTKISQN